MIPIHRLGDRSLFNGLIGCQEAGAKDTRLQTEEMLREIAHVLYLTHAVRESMIGKRPDGGARSIP